MLPLLKNCPAPGPRHLTVWFCDKHFSFEKIPDGQMAGLRSEALRNCFQVFITEYPAACPEGGRLQRLALSQCHREFIHCDWLYQNAGDCRGAHSD
jgi:hypothetical protein